MASSTPAVSKEVALPSKFGCNDAEKLSCVVVHILTNQKVSARVRCVSSNQDHDVLKISFRPPHGGKYHAFVSVNGVSLSSPIVLQVDHINNQVLKPTPVKASSESSAVDDVIDAYFEDVPSSSTPTPIPTPDPNNTAMPVSELQQHRGRSRRTKSKRRTSASPPRQKRVLLRNHSEPVIRNFQTREVVLIPRCCLCQSTIKPGQEVELDGYYFCRSDFRHLYLKPRKAHSLKKKMLHQGRVTVEVLRQIPDINLEGLKMSQVLEIKDAFRSCESYRQGQILRPDLVPALYAAAGRIVGIRYITPIVEQELQFIASRFRTQSSHLVRETEFLLMMLRFHDSWFKGGLRTRTASRETTPSIHHKHNSSSQHGSSQVHKGLQMSGTTADAWMMY